MIVKSTLTIGGTEFEFQSEEKDDKEALLRAISLATPRTFCNICRDNGMENKRLLARRAETEKGSFIYISVKCKCDASSTLGEYKQGGYFWKEYEVYQKKETKDNS